MAPKLVALLPPHRVYIEPFFGSGAVLFAKEPATHEIINDLDGVLVTFLRVLRTRRAELEEVCALTPHSRAEFEDARFADGTNDEVLDGDELEIARRFWVRVNQSFAKLLGNHTGFSVTTARTQSIPGSILGRLGRFGPCAERIMRCTIECCDGVNLIERMATDDTAIYVDPPYMGDTRRSRKSGDATSDYRFDMGSVEEHERLAKVLHSTPAAVLLSGYHSPLYDQLYGDWNRIEVPVLSHSSNSVRTERGTRLEVVWSNRDVNAGKLDFA